MKQIDDGWETEKSGYGVYNESQTIELANRLLGVQNIDRGEVMAIHATIKIMNTGNTNHRHNNE